MFVELQARENIYTDIFRVISLFDDTITKECSGKK